MPNEVNIYTPRYLAEVVRQAPPIHTYFRDTFFTNIKTFSTERVDIDLVKGDRRMAAFVHPRVGARYFIREYLKPIPETEWSLIMAKVPELERRTNCTLSTLFSLYAVLNCQTVSVSESWPHGGNESGA